MENAGITKPKKRGSSKTPAYATPLLKLLKQTHPESSMESKAAWCINGIIEDFVGRLIAKSFDMAQLEGKNTLKAKHAKAATGTLLTGELQRLAIAHGERAVTKYLANV